MVNINQSLDAIMTVEGAQCAALVDSGSGMLMGAVGTGVDMEIAAAGNTEVVRAKLKTMKNLGIGPRNPKSREGVYHNALDDAITQAVHLQEIFACLKPH